ncbi:azurin [Pseudacidovorax sp. 1753]|uniref:azurin n=1 Tax=Pseudacidovorax sp. 1753 TaxID=3156419 RepID=UPI003397C9E5
MSSRFIVAAALLAAVSTPLYAADCSVQIEGNDAMQFNKSSIEVPKACKSFTVQLKHAGKMPKAAMGHNWVLAKTADVQAVANDGIAAGLDKQYVKPGDARVIAHTKVVGGGESDSVAVDVSKLKVGESYTFFCSFPGHSGVMKGSFALAK